TDPEIEELHFGALPAIGRYFTQSCTKQSDGVFRVEVEVPKGFLCYHFYYDNNPANVILDANNTQIGAKNGHSVSTIGTEVILPVRFFERAPYVYALDEEYFAFKLVASQAWIQTVELEVYRDGQIVHAGALPSIFTKSGYTYFEQKVRKSDLYKGEHYAFKVLGEDQTYYLGNHGTLLKEPTLFFATDRLAGLEAKPITKNEAVYHIFPDRFAKSVAVDETRANHASTVELQPWGNEPTHDSFFGGNLQGIAEKLPHLQRLGVSQVYLTPIFEATSNHRYDCINYTTIDPLLGNMEDFRAFVSHCHAHSIKVILDIVLNHCGVDFFAFQDVLEHQEQSAYRDWFLIHHFPVHPDTTPLSYRCWWNNSRMPEFNLDNPDVKKHLFDVCKFWVEEFGIDGWRIDVSSEMELSFLEELRTMLKALRPDLTVIGENWNDASLFLDGSQALDGATNYLYWWKAFVPRFVDQRMKVSEFIFFIMDIYFTYSHPSILKSWNVLSSHDIPRFLSLLPDPSDIFPATFLQVTLPGTPVVYYGEEIGLEGMGDPLNRACMPWDVEAEAHHLYGWYRSLLRVYHAEPALNQGHLAVPFVDDEQEILIHHRYWNEESIFCITNFSASAKVVDLSLLGAHGDREWTELLTGQTVTDTITLPPKRGCLLK
ncbi:MAG: glycoside hydrolase family 13 protein, partial [Tumebacillaceae bacterium]